MKNRIILILGLIIAISSSLAYLGLISIPFMSSSFSGVSLISIFFVGLVISLFSFLNTKQSNNRFANWPRWLKFGSTFDFLILVGLLIPGVNFVVYLFFIAVPIGIFRICPLGTYSTPFVSSCDVFPSVTIIGFISFFIFYFLIGSIIGLVYDQIKKGNRLVKKIVLLIFVITIIGLLSIFIYNKVDESIRDKEATVTFNLICDNNSTVLIKYIPNTLGKVDKITVGITEGEERKKYEMISVSENNPSFIDEESGTLLSEENGQYNFVDGGGKIIATCSRDIII